MKSRVTAIIPAHNEAENVGETVRSLLAQTAPPDVIVVVSDNSSDATVEVARAAGAQVIETVDNKDRKAGALNYALRLMLPQMEPYDFVMICDADTAVAPQFLEIAAVEVFDPRIGAVGGIFEATPPRSWVERFQANEYGRYALELERTQRLMVLSGTASVIRVEALREVAAARGGAIPGLPGDVYDRAALTEDNELTLAMKTLGWRMVSPQECKVVTEVMPSWRDLSRQRQRWYRGAIDNLRSYGFTRATRRYWFQQGMLLLGVFAMSLYILLMTLDAVLGLMGFNPFWLLVGVIFWVERVITAPRGGKKVAALFLPELAYEVFLQWIFLSALWQVMRGKETEWHHVSPKPLQGETNV